MYQPPIYLSKNGDNTELKNIEEEFLTSGIFVNILNMFSYFLRGH